MKELPYLCTNNRHFTCNEQIQVDGVAMGAPLAPLIVDIFMIELERSLVPNRSKIKFWKCYVSHSICFFKTGSIEYIISVSVE